jgi:hypothetical protein
MSEEKYFIIKVLKGPRFTSWKETKNIPTVNKFLFPRFLSLYCFPGCSKHGNREDHENSVNLRDAATSKLILHAHDNNNTAPNGQSHQISFFRLFFLLYAII